MIASQLLGITAGVLTLAMAVSHPSVPDASWRLRPAPSHGYAEGAPPGYSGGFKEQSCDACHFFADVNKGPGTLAVEGIPERYTAGDTYRLTVTLAQPGMKLAGFQLTSRFTDDGAQAGTLAAEPDAPVRVGVQTDAEVQYAGQKKEGATVAGAEGARWTVLWTAPASSKAVAFNVAANAANGDQRADGDYVYVVSKESQSSGGGRD